MSSSSNCPPGTNQPTTQSLAPPSTASDGTTTPPAPEDTTTQPATPSSSDQPSAGNLGGGGGQVQKEYEPPVAALPYRGDELKIIDFYAYADPTDPYNVKHITKVGEDVHTTFVDGTIETANLFPLNKLDEVSQLNIRITPGGWVIFG